MPYGSISVDQINNTTGYSLGAGDASIMKNRIINGAMVISQRGTSFSSPNNYTLDRFATANAGGQTYTVAQSTDAPNGFSNSLLVTSTNAVAAGTTNYDILYQVIEGYNIADLGWGTANAKTVTVSFWVKASVTGNYGLTLRGGASTTYYVSSYNIPTANTWTYITLTIPGPTTDTWGSTNGFGMYVYFDLGVGSTYSAAAGSWGTGNYFGLTGGVKFSATNGATFYITGVQLEVGSFATGFEYRQYGQELALCQRYYQLANCSMFISVTGASASYTTMYYKVTARNTPTVTKTGNWVGSGENGTSVNTVSVNEVGLYNSTSNQVGGQFTISSEL